MNMPESAPHPVPSAGSTTFEIVDKASQRGRDQLIDSHGFVYSKEGKKVWRCTKRWGSTKCKGTVHQIGDNFTIKSWHSHDPKANQIKAKKMNVKIKEACASDHFKGAPIIVDEVWDDIINENDVLEDLPTKESLARTGNRVRESTRPSNPSV